MRTRYLCIYVIVCDLVMCFGGVPLERATWLALTQHPGDHQLLVRLLAANVALLILCVAGFYASAAASVRGVRFAFMRFSRASERPRTES